MEPDVVEIPPPPLMASGSRNRKPRKAFPEVIDVESYEFRSGGGVLNNNNNNNLVDKKNKGKAIQVDSVSYNNVHSHHPPLNVETFQDYYGHNNPFGKVANQPIDVDDYSMFQDVLDPKNVPAGAEVMVPWGLNSSSNGTGKSSRSILRSQSMKETGNSYLPAATVPQSWDYSSGSFLPQHNQATYPSPSFNVVQPQTPGVVMVPNPSPNSFRYDASASSFQPIAAGVTSSVENSNNVRKTKQDFLRDFKRFDTVDDFSDHHYVSKGKSSKQHSKNWVKKVQDDWKILEKDLPEAIYVRACETRMDLLRAVIIGAEGTPYHDGLFFFDIQFPDTYPSVPPKVYYHSGGLRINPNLYNCGKVCLSLLGTWSGSAREKWLPKESTMLQLLVSIQALILNQKPYFNEPGYERSKGTQSGEAHSTVYSENVFILSLRTMVYSMRKPPTHFEEFVRCHYFLRSHDIVKACNAYKNGVPLGSMVKGGVQDLEQTSQSGSKKFRADVASFMQTVVDEFVKLGVKELAEKPKPPEFNANIRNQSNNTNRKRSRSSSIKDFLANIGRCVFQQ
ncbi:PREDICTED: putative ubiquitin-conjugating enzyme E2 38 [Camelina sativa]|uniref:Ubiquitin-conjugating enzyme E2 38 n=1 Tax=Camelina sativa TaxID=90675 RepID=A0ABM0X2Y6_CAMSA|nr:PREDICTED: putative ubiquitin-conjugating enzyme E2 38 [Camelina sativa]XP_019094688.1 PREDICTED: putative ubiquitin-conjugating enzyme E2 38 [Camelina sativa]